MKINILITCYNRPKYLKECLRHIGIANRDGNHDIKVYVVSNKIRLDFEPRISIKNIKGPNQNIFCKSEYLNIAISEMRDDFEYLFQIDCDLIIKPSLFDDVIFHGNDWNVLGGEKLTPESTEKIFDQESNYITINMLPVEIQTTFYNKQRAYVGNIALTKQCYLFYLRLLGIPTLYDETFKGWGSEDSLLSITSTRMTISGLIEKDYHFDCWKHLFHEREPEKPDFDKVQYQKNTEYLNNKLIEYAKTITDYRAN